MFCNVSASLCLLLMVHKYSCSRVIDGLEPKSMLVSDYCPNKYCKEPGAHVICTHYNPNSVFGPKCHDPNPNVSMTPELADLALIYVNKIRSKAALGQERGADGLPLPKAYGVFRLKWDSELATLAQLWANQCFLTFDLCRATKKFADPGQNVIDTRKTGYGEIRVSIENETRNFITQSFKSWYLSKDYVTEEMAMNVPNWVDNNLGRYYLNMVSGASTHMGCGISVYSQFSFTRPDGIPGLFDIYLLVCNFSVRPATNKPVYRTHPSTQVGDTIKCGCPSGYDEDEDCLCVESQLPTEQNTSSICDKNQNCKPTIVLLPIFTVEDVPAPVSTKSLKPTMYFNDTRDDFMDNANFTSLRVGPSPVHDILKGYDTQQNVLSHKEATHNHPRVSYIMTNVNEHTSDKIQQTSKYRYVTRPNTQQMITMNHNDEVAKAKSRYSKTSPTVIPISEHRYQIEQSQQIGNFHPEKRLNSHSTKQSIFSRAKTFQLPASSKTSSLKIIQKNRNVTSRKDFTNTHHIFNDYLANIRNLISKPRSKVKIPTFQKKYNIRSNRANCEQLSNNGFNLSREPTRRTNTKKSNEGTNKSLLAILDYLEQEIKNNKWDDEEKYIINDKLRKIHKAVVGNSANLSNLNHNRKDNSDNENENERNNKLGNKYNVDVNSAEDLSKRKMEEPLFMTEDILNSEQSKFYNTYSDPKNIAVKNTKSINSLFPYRSKNEKYKYSNKRTGERRRVNDDLMTFDRKDEYVDHRDHMKTSLTSNSNEKNYNTNDLIDVDKRNLHRLKAKYLID